MAKPDPFEEMDEDELIEEVIIPLLLTQLAPPPRPAPSLPEKEPEAELEIALHPEVEPAHEELPIEEEFAPEALPSEEERVPQDPPDLLTEIFRELFGPPRRGE